MKDSEIKISDENYEKSSQKNQNKKAKNKIETNLDIKKSIIDKSIVGMPKKNEGRKDINKKEKLDSKNNDDIKQNKQKDFVAAKLDNTSKPNKKNHQGATVKNSLAEEKNKNCQCFFGHKKDENIFESFLTNKMFAHRGLHDEQNPENSLGAFKKAIDEGYGIELDVNPIIDGTPVVFHDSKMSRMTGKDKYIQNLSSEELKTTTLNNSNETIPTLIDVLNFVDGKVPLLIEIKHQDKIGMLEKSILELLKNYQGEFAIQSFDPHSLQWFKTNAPKIWRGQLSSFFKGENLNFIKKAVLSRLATTKIASPNFISYDLKNLPNRFVNRHKDLPLLTWTVNSQEQYIKALQVADNIIFQNFIPKL